MSLVKHATLVGAALAALAFAAPAQAQSAGAIAAATTTVNVRSGPGTSHRVLDVLRTGQEVRIVGVSGGWCDVEKSGPDGWVSCRYLAEVRGTRPAPDRGRDRGVRIDATPATANTSVNVRSGPGTNFRVVDGLRRGERVTIVGRSGSWCDIEKAGPDGWVACRFLTEGRGGVTVRPAPGLSFSFSFGRGDGFSIRPPRDRDGSAQDPVCLVTFFSADQVAAGADANVERARVMSRAQAERLADRDPRSAVFEYGTPQQTRETCAYLDAIN